jgi:hypothetical protein
MPEKNESAPALAHPDNENVSALAHPLLVCESGCNPEGAVDRFNASVKKSRVGVRTDRQIGERPTNSQLKSFFQRKLRRVAFRSSRPSLVHTRHTFVRHSDSTSRLIFRCTVCGGERTYGHTLTRDINWIE